MNPSRALFGLLLRWIAIVLPVSSPLYAAHLVGGHLTYTCLGGNDYEVTLRVYRDCGGNGAAFDNLADLAVYDASNNLILNVGMSKGVEIVLPNNSTGNPCLSSPPGLCTEYVDYVSVLNLPPIAGGYLLVHQRCCRNGGIDNVANSGTYGNTYSVRIPDLGANCNSSPQFTAPPPIVLCLGDPLQVQIAASDADGDSLYFEFCEIFNGGGQSGGSGCTAVTPQPSCPPPYTAVPFSAGYTATNPMPGSPAIGIEDSTGKLFGLPNQLGRFVVGVCVTEYRNGLPLSTVRLDYQFIVTQCVSNLVADMLTPVEDPDINCVGLTVGFVNQSPNFTTLHWDFGVPGVLDDTANVSNPSFTYPYADTFTVQLIVNPGFVCSDTTSFQFVVQPEVSGNLLWTGVPCFEVQNIQFEAIGNWPPGSSFVWDFGPGASPIGWGQLVPPPVSWSAPGWHVAECFVSYPPNCQIVLSDSIFISNLNATVDAGPDQIIAPGQSAVLGANGGQSYYWYSDVPARYSGRYEQSIVVWPFDDTTTFYVRVLDALGCAGVDSVRVFVLGPESDDPPANTLTPNGDGLNESLDLSRFIESDPADFLVYNRWGSLVYERFDYDNQWRGQDAGGNPLPDGTYYVLLVRSGQVLYKGPVHLIRGR